MYLLFLNFNLRYKNINKKFNVLKKKNNNIERKLFITYQHYNIILSRLT